VRDVLERVDDAVGVVVSRVDAPPGKRKGFGVWDSGFSRQSGRCTTWKEKA